MRWHLGFPAIRACPVAAPVVVPGLPAQGAASRATDERSDFDTQATRHPRLPTTRERPVQGDAIRSHWPAHSLGVMSFLAALVMASEAGAGALFPGVLL